MHSVRTSAVGLTYHRFMSSCEKWLPLYRQAFYADVLLIPDGSTNLGRGIRATRDVIESLSPRMKQIISEAAMAVADTAEGDGPPGSNKEATYAFGARELAVFGARKPSDDDDGHFCVALPGTRRAISLLVQKAWELKYEECSFEETDDRSVWSRIEDEGGATAMLEYLEICGQLGVQVEYECEILADTVNEYISEISEYAGRLTFLLRWHRAHYLSYPTHALSQDARRRPQHRGPMGPDVWMLDLLPVFPVALLKGSPPDEDDEELEQSQNEPVPPTKAIPGTKADVEEDLRHRVEKIMAERFRLLLDHPLLLTMKLPELCALIDGMPEDRLRDGLLAHTRGTRHAPSFP